MYVIYVHPAEKNLVSSITSALLLLQFPARHECGRSCPSGATCLPRLLFQ